jgi:sorbitol-specific phosphotransferase system component IIBC
MRGTMRAVMTTSPAHARSPRSIRWLGRLALAAAGVGAVVWLVLEAGGERVAAVLSSVLPWFPLLICLEGFRIAAEALTTHTLFAAARERSR